MGICDLSASAGRGLRLTHLKVPVADHSTNCKDTWTLFNILVSGKDFNSDLVARRLVP